MPGTLYLTNGKSINGKLVIQTGNIFGSRVKIYEEGDTRPMHFDLSEVEGYELRNQYYALKERRQGLSINRIPVFMKRLTPAESKIHLYEYEEKITTNNGNQSSSTRYQTDYFMELPGEKGIAVYAVNSSRFVPNFDEKMSRMVQDCPALSAKIASKTDGYFYAQVTVFKEKRPNVLLNIIDEYNRCN